MEAGVSDDEVVRLRKLASKICRYMDKDRDDKLRTVLDIIRESKHSLAALDSSGVGKLVKKLSKREDSIGRLACKLIKKWKKHADRSENDSAHAPVVKVEVKIEDVADHASVYASVDRDNSRRTAHGSSNGATKALTEDKLAEAERIDPAYAAILQKLYASSSAIPDADDNANDLKPHTSGQNFSHNQQRHGENGTTYHARSSTAAILHPSESVSRRHPNPAVSRRAPIQDGGLAAAQFEITRATGHSQLYSGSRRHKNAAASFSNGGHRQHIQREIPRLQSLCLQVLKENINSIDELGGASVAYHIIKPVLEACDAQQLSRIEEANPHLYIDGDTNELWKRHVQRDFPKAEVPDEFVHKRPRKRKRTDSFAKSSGDDDDESDADSDEDDAEPYIAWRDVYAHQTAERERNFQRITARIQQSKRERDDPMKRTIAAEIIGNGARAPREVRRAQNANASAAEPAVFRGGASALARQIVASSSMGESISVTSKGTNSASNTVVKIGGSGGPRNQQKASKRAFAPLMARSLKMLKR